MTFLLGTFIFENLQTICLKLLDDVAQWRSRLRVCMVFLGGGIDCAHSRTMKTLP